MRRVAGGASTSDGAAAEAMVAHALQAPSGGPTLGPGQGGAARTESQSRPAKSEIPLTLQAPGQGATFTPMAARW